MEVDGRVFPYEGNAYPGRFFFGISGLEDQFGRRGRECQDRTDAMRRHRSRRPGSHRVTNPWRRSRFGRRGRDGRQRIRAQARRESDRALGDGGLCRLGVDRQHGAPPDGARSHCPWRIAGQLGVEAHHIVLRTGGSNSLRSCCAGGRLPPRWHLLVPGRRGHHCNRTHARLLLRSTSYGLRY